MRSEEEGGVILINYLFFIFLLNCLNPLKNEQFLMEKNPLKGGVKDRSAGYLISFLFLFYLFYFSFFVKFICKMQ